jgi:hypothetical protein
MQGKTSRVLAAAVLGLVAWLSPLEADEIDDFFQQQNGEGTDTTGTTTQGSPLKSYQAQQEKLSLAWNLSAGGGMYAGWHSLGDLSDAVATFDHSAVGSISLTSTLDVRPFDYLRIHESSSISYPGSTFTFSLADINWFDELFFDYALPSGLAVRMGKYGIAWGNARILGVANLPGRTVNAAVLDPEIEILPSWLQSPTPALWLKGALPLGAITVTGLMSLPGASDQGLSSLVYAGQAEWVRGKTYVGLSGLYQQDRAPRCALMLKTSAWSIDFYVDSCLAFLDGEAPLASIMGGLYYQPGTGPEIKALYELRWNGESSAASGLVSDALAQGGLSQAMGFSWSSVGGSELDLGATWYHYWEDGSGAVVAILSYPLAPSLSLKALIPLIYGGTGSYYLKNPPSETYGYAAGAALMIVIKADF